MERGVTVTSIPDGGYVISGHGTGRDFIRASVPLGANIILDQDKKEFAVTTSLNSFYVNTKSTVDEIISDAETKIKQLYDVDADALEAKIDEARALLETLEETKNNIEKKMEEGTWSNEEKTREMMAYNTAKLEAEATAYEILALSAESKPSPPAPYGTDLRKKRSKALRKPSISMRKSVSISSLWRLSTTAILCSNRTTCNTTRTLRALLTKGIPII